MNRRDFLRAGASTALTAVAGTLGAQQPAQTMSGPMEQGAYRATRLPPKPGATPSMTVEERDALEHRIRCQCGCTLDVFTCRTTDFTCQVSPAMHRDVLSLVAGGYDADEIIAAFEGTYGERVLMAPKPEGFNWVGYLLPFGAIGAGAVALFALLRRWRGESPAPAPAGTAVDATPAELAELEAALRRDQ